MLLSFIYNKTDDEKLKTTINNEYEELLNEEIIPRLKIKLDTYEINEKYYEELQEELSGFYKNIDFFPEYLKRYIDILKQLDQYSRENQRRLEGSFFLNGEINAVEKSKAMRYLPFFQEIYKRYVYFSYVMLGAEKKRTFKTFQSNILGRWNAFLLDMIDVKDIYLTIKKVRPWYIYIDRRNGINTYELVYVKGNFFPDWWYHYNGVMSYGRWLWGAGEKKLMDLGEEILYWGRGNLCNFSSENILNVLDKEIVTKLERKDMPIINTQNPIELISAYIQGDLFFCVSPEEFVRILNEQETKLMVKAYKGNKCLICGTTHVRSGACFCDNHLGHRSYY